MHPKLKASRTKVFEAYLLPFHFSLKVLLVSEMFTTLILYFNSLELSQILCYNFLKRGDIMSKKTVITIGREFGSGGREIAQKLSEAMGIPMYDKELIHLTAKKGGYSEEVLQDIDETASKSLLYSLSLNANQHLPLMMNGSSLPLGDKAFIICSEIIRDLANKGPGIIVGRCADSILRENENLLTVFIHSDTERRIDRICSLENCSRGEAATMIKKADRRRSVYHNYYSNTKWGNRESYDLCIDSKIGVQTAVEIIKTAAEALTV